MIKLYDKVKLDTGEIAYIVEILGNGKAFVADIERDNDTDTDFIYPSQIISVIE